MPGGRPRKYTSEEEKRKVVIQRAIEWRKNHPEQYQATLKKKKESDPEFYIRKRIAIAKYTRNNKEKVNKLRRERNKKRKLEDPVFKFKEITKKLVQNSFKRGLQNFQKRKRTEEILGCSVSKFTEYILSLCPKDITLKDFGKYGYHIDHIIPVSIAKSEEEVIKLCHYTNLQPLWWEDNIRKSNKIIDKDAK